MGVNKVKAFQTIEGYNLMCVSPPFFFCGISAPTASYTAKSTIKTWLDSFLHNKVKKILRRT